MKALSRLRTCSASKRALGIAIAVGLVIASVGACGKRGEIGVAGDSTNPALVDRCSIPNEGCECLEPGRMVDCGEVKHRSADGYVQCSMGKRQCLGGSWGKCVGETDVTRKSFMAGGSLSTRALGTGARCGTPGGGPANPCDPYCNAFVDDATGLTLPGGLSVTDGGITIPPVGGVGDAGATGGFFSTAGGISRCPPSGNLVGPACVPGTPSALTTCQQDFHCDHATSTCLWNGGPGYKDPLVVGGVDLTIGAPCGEKGSAPGFAPVCNRGDTLVPAGSPILLWVSGGGAPDGCSSLGPPTYSFALTTDLAPGGCEIFTLGNSPGNKIITVNAGPPGGQAIAEAPGRCANNSAYWKNDGPPGCGECTYCNTQVSGKVYDPTGAGTPSATVNNLPLPGIDVFQPAGALKPLVDGVACDSCESQRSSFQALTVTDASGSFTLTNVSPGPAVPIVVQSGRWRRMVSVAVNACVNNNAYAPGTFRMPRDTTEGALPKIAVVTADEESLACLMQKIGVAPREIGGAGGAADPKRVQLFRYNGMTTSAPVAPASSTLWNAATLNRYTAVIGDCAGDYENITPTSADRTALRAYVDGGGRYFGDHWSAVYTLNSPEFPVTATWDLALPYPVLPARGRIDNATPPESLLRNWLADPGVLGSTDYGAGWIRVDEGRLNARALAAGTYRWISGRVDNDWGANAPPGNPTIAPDYTISFSFETPFPAGNCGGGGSGRVMYNGMHVNPGRGTTGTFPDACNFEMPLEPEEKAIEFQLFQLTACAIGGSTPPPPPVPPPPLPIVEYERTYRGVCAVGERVKWGPFYWQATIPPTTSIAFRAATADTEAALPPSPPPGAPTTATVGAATMTAIAPSWDCNGCPTTPVTVDSQLKADTGAESKEYLRIYMQFKPTLFSPVLASWRQIYDCIPAE